MEILGVLCLCHTIGHRYFVHRVPGNVDMGSGINVVWTTASPEVRSMTSTLSGNYIALPIQALVCRDAYGFERQRHQNLSISL